MAWSASLGRYGNSVHGLHIGKFNPVCTHFCSTFEDTLIQFLYTRLNTFCTHVCSIFEDSFELFMYTLLNKLCTHFCSNFVHTFVLFLHFYVNFLYAFEVFLYILCIMFLPISETFQHKVQVN